MALKRLSGLPTSLRFTVLSPTPPLRVRWTHKLNSHFNFVPPRNSFPRRALWLLPIAGSITLYLLPHPSSHLPSFLSSSSLIPADPKPKRTLISSPAEPRLPIISRIVHYLYTKIWDPLRTAARFIHLAALFVPVIVFMPMLLIGPPEEALSGERWGAVWWYGLLVGRMAAAGPTFIKVCPLSVLPL